jgi:lipopolysaccharide export system permease protein
VFTLPGITGIILPICALVSSIVAVNKMRQDKELTVFMTSGKSSFSIFLPILVFSMFIVGTVMCLQMSISPSAYKHFEDIQENVKSQISMSIIKPGIFNAFGNSIIYIGGKTSTKLENVFISYIPVNKKSTTNIITAKSGTYEKEGDKYFIILKNGYRQELNNNNFVISTLKFEHFSYDVTPFFNRYYSRSKSPVGKTQKELLNVIKKTDNIEIKRNYTTEYHARFITPFITIINAFIIAIFLIVPREKYKGRFDAIKSFSLGIVNQIFITTLVNVSTKSDRFVIFNYIIVFALILGFSIIFGRRRI